MWWKSVPGRKITLPAGLACEQTPLPSGEIGNGGLVTVNHRRPFSDFSCAGGGGGGGVRGSLYTGYAGSSLASVYKLKDVVYAIFSLMQSIRDS